MEEANLIESAWTENQLSNIPTIKDNILQRIISFCISSGKADPILFKEKDKTFSTRGQLHCILLQPFGTGKSTALKNLPDIYPLINFTLPGFVGTINKNGDLIDSALMSAAGRTLFIDEFHNLGDSARRAMLSLLEDQRYSRALGFSTEKKMSINKKFFKCRIDKNYINISHCRFSCLATGLYMRKRVFNDMALASRFMILNVNTDRDYIWNMLKGEGIQEYKKYNLLGGVKFDNYVSFLDDVKKVVDLMPFSDDLITQYLSRVVNDLARVVCYHNEIKGNMTIERREDYTDWLGLTPLMFYNHSTSSLTLAEYQILDSLIFDGQNHTKISNDLKVSRQYVIDCHAHFRSLGLLP